MHESQLFMKFSTLINSLKIGRDTVLPHMCSEPLVYLSLLKVILLLSDPSNKHAFLKVILK